MLKLITVSEYVRLSKIGRPAVIYDDKLVSFIIRDRTFPPSQERYVIWCYIADGQVLRYGARPPGALLKCVPK